MVAAVNFQVSILKVLSSYPNRLGTLADIKRDLALLATSGADWAKYSKRLGATFPSLDVFSLGFVQRYSFGWRLTARGVTALEMMEESARAVVTNVEAILAATSATVPEKTHLSSIESDEKQTRPAISPADRRALFTVVHGGREMAA